MAQMRCPRCKNPIDLQEKAPGPNVTCPTCGNVTPISRPLSKKWIAAIAGAVSLVLCCPLTGIMAAIAIPNFIRFQARAKQAECKTQLRSWYLAQQAYHVEHEAYQPRFDEVGFSPGPGNRYAYYVSNPARGELTGTTISADAKFDSDALSVDALPEQVTALLGMSGECPDCEITAACAGNVDNDDTIDVWVISTGKLPFENEAGQKAGPGELAHVVDDIQR